MGEVLALVPAVGLAGLFCWQVAQLPTPVLSRLLDVLRRNETLAHLIGCPWCIGAWLTAALTLAVHARLNLLDPVLTPLGWTAAAGVTGLLSLLVTSGADDVLDIDVDDVEA